MAFKDLFGPKWKHKDSNVRKAAVVTLTDQAVLAAIAKTDEDVDVRRAAIRKLTDPAALADMLSDRSRGLGERLDLGRTLDSIGWQPTTPHARALHLAALAGMKQATEEDVPHLLQVHDMGLVGNKELAHILRDVVSPQCSDVRLLAMVLRQAVASRNQMLELAAKVALIKAAKRDWDTVSDEMNSLLRDGIACNDEALQDAALTVLNADHDPPLG